IISDTYFRDDLGRITQRDETILDPLGVATTTTYLYTYRHEGWLESYGVRVGSTLTTTTYGYDANGNRTSATGGSTCKYDDQDRLVSCGTVSYSFNNNGAITSDGTSTFAWDALGGRVGTVHDERGRVVVM